LSSDNAFNCEIGLSLAIFTLLSELHIDFVSGVGEKIRREIAIDQLVCKSGSMLSDHHVKLSTN
jgi:hypothetical protein